MLCTCRNASVVDYVIVSPEIFTRIQGMVVNVFDPLISDVHNLIEMKIDKCMLNEVSLDTKINNENFNEEEIIDTKFIWKQDMADKFNTTLNKNMVDGLKRDMKKILNNPDMICDVTMNKLNDQLFVLLNNAANECKLKRMNKEHEGEKSRDSGNRTGSKNWFDTTCKQERKSTIMLRISIENVKQMRICKN
jgi:hypothetical protein